MTLTLRPEIARLIDDQLKSGRYSTREEFVEAAIKGMCQIDEEEIDADTQSAIDEARAQLDRGEGIPFEEVRAYWQKRLHGG